jgi:hypothetical protein
MEPINKNQVTVKIANKSNPNSLDVLSDRIDFFFADNSEMKQRMIDRDKVVIINEIKHGIQA